MKIPFMKNLFQKLKIPALFLIALCFMPSAAAQNAFAQDTANTLVYAGENEDTINPILNEHQELPTIIFPVCSNTTAKEMPFPTLRNLSGTMKKA